jgi:hypothetical protein
MGSGLADLPQPLVERKRGAFAWVLQNGHDHPIEKPGAPFDQIQVAQGQGVKASRVEGSHRTTLF